MVLRLKPIENEYSAFHNYIRGGGLLRGQGGFLEADGLLRGVEPSQVVLSLLSRVSSGGWIWVVREAWTRGVIIMKCGVHI